MWVYDFIKCLPGGLFWVKQKPAEKERIEPIVCSIPPSNIYKFDETGYQLGQGKPQKVTSRNRQRTRILSGERGILLTRIECVAADGWVMEPYFVAQGDVHLERWCEGGTLSEASKIAVSSSRYLNDALGIDWLHFFNLHTRHRSRGKKRLLLFDGHGSHLTWEFLQLCESWDIVPFVFPPHTAHIFQPLDGSLFRALEQAFHSKNNMIAQWGGDALDKAFFFREITDIRKQAMKSRTIRKLFAERGIPPFQPALVIDRLNAARSPTPELYWQTENTPPPQSSSIPSSPPITMLQARHTQDKLFKLAERVGTDIGRQFNRVARTQVKLAEEINLLTSTLQHQLPMMPSPARKSQKQVGKFGALTTKDANRMVKRRKEKEEQASVRKAKRNAVSEKQPVATTAAEEHLMLETPSRMPQMPGYCFGYTRTRDSGY